MLTPQWRTAPKRSVVRRISRLSSRPCRPPIRCRSCRHPCRRHVRRRASARPSARRSQGSRRPVSGAVVPVRRRGDAPAAVGGGGPAGALRRHVGGSGVDRRRSASATSSSTIDGRRLPRREDELRPRRVHRPAGPGPALAGRRPPPVAPGRPRQPGDRGLPSRAAVAVALGLEAGAAGVALEPASGAWRSRGPGTPADLRGAHPADLHEAGPLRCDPGHVSPGHRSVSRRRAHSIPGRTTRTSASAASPCTTSCRPTWNSRRRRWRMPRSAATRRAVANARCSATATCAAARCCVTRRATSRARSARTRSSRRATASRLHRGVRAHSGLRQRCQEHRDLQGPGGARRGGDRGGAGQGERVLMRIIDTAGARAATVRPRSAAVRRTANVEALGLARRVARHGCSASCLTTWARLGASGCRRRRRTVASAARCTLRCRARFPC